MILYCTLLQCLLYLNIISILPSSILCEVPPYPSLRHHHTTTADDQNVKQDWQTALITDIFRGRVAAVEISSAAGLRSAIILATETLPIQRPLCAGAGSFVKRVGQRGGPFFFFWDKHPPAGQPEGIISFTVSAPSSVIQPS